MKKFDIPESYKSSIILKIKGQRELQDPHKKNYLPTELDFGPIKFFIARHFGFCYGVENAIEIAYKTIQENPNKRIYLLSEMIHNQRVNDDLKAKGVQFIMNYEGTQKVMWNKLTPSDIVIIPAFGTSLEIENKLNKIGIDTKRYNTTCPFVEKVWNRAYDLGQKGYTIIIHGKNNHEETRATFSHSKQNAPSIIIRNMKEAEIIGDIILNKIEPKKLYDFFKGKISAGFMPQKDLDKIGVVNQTTMLASETEKISDYFKSVMIKKFGLKNLKEHFADTRDTLCYATNDNQRATYGLLKKEADFALVIGGYNSSNTSHIVELLKSKFPTYFISSEEKIISKQLIRHFDISMKKEIETENYIPIKDKISVVLTSGASCPDSIVDNVLKKLVSYFDDAVFINEYFST